MYTRQESSGSISSRPILTPHSRRSSSSATGPRLATPSSTSDSRSETPDPTPEPGTTSASPHLVQSSSPFVFGALQPSHHSFDPDTPIPSVERDDSASSHQESTPSTVHYTPSQSSTPQSTTQVADPEASLRGISVLGDLRLNSRHPPSPPVQRASRTPSIHVTSSPQVDVAGASRSARSDSLAAGVAAMRMDSQRADSLSPAGTHERRSASPSRRRRSGSGVRREVHQVESESPPEVFSRMAEVQEALSNARALTGRIKTLLSSSTMANENGSSIWNLHNQAVRLDNFQLPSSRIIGLVGDSGVGKSSLINSLLDRTTLARASGSGTACTCAVTEYHFHERDDFVVHVDYFSLEQLKQQFEELLRARRDFEGLGARRAGGPGDDMSDSNRQQLEKKAKLALETFEAGFGGKLQEIPGILSTVHFGRAIASMVQWASELLPTQAERMSFGAIDECSNWLKDLSSDLPPAPGPLNRSPNARPSWPFIQKIRVYLKASILSKGLIIADLPGLRDLNSARQAITERYIRQCHQILVVARIDRAITDESIKYICELARQVNLTKIDIVCTRAEEINTREAIHDWPGERATIEDMQQAIDSKREEIEDLKEDIDDFEQDGANLTREQERELLNLQRDYLQAKRSEATQELELQKFIVRLRNDKVSHGLRENHRNHPIAASLQIFCVSNQVYRKNREKPADVALPYLNFSGIIELRRYCIGIVGQSRLQAIRAFIQDDIPALIGSIELWTEAGSGSASAESKQKILDAVDAVQQELDQLTCPGSRLYQVSRTLQNEFRDKVYVPMAGNSTHWSAAARQASLRWEGWHHSSYKAFCSNYGNHHTKTMGHHCWNEDAIQGMAADLPTFWDTFVAETQTEMERIYATVTHAFIKIIQTAVSVAAHMSRANDTGSAMRTFAANLRHRERLICYGMEQVADDLESQLSSLRADTLSSVRTSFIGRLMEHAYHEANMQYDTGSDRRRKNIITGRFSSAALFDGHRHSCRDKLRELTQGLQEKLTAAVDVQVELVEADMQLLRDGNAILESERDTAFKRRVEEGIRIAKLEMERLARVVEQEQS